MTDKINLRKVVKGEIGNIFGVKLFASSLVKMGEFIPVKGNIYISSEDFKKVKSGTPEEAGKILGTLVNSLSKKL